MIQEKVELPLLYVDLLFEESGHIGHILEERWLHEGFLTNHTRDLSDLINKIKNAWRDVDYLYAHDFEKLSKQLSGFTDEVDTGDFTLAILVSLTHHKLFHLYVVILAEKL